MSRPFGARARPRRLGERGGGDAASGVSLGQTAVKLLHF